MADIEIKNPKDRLKILINGYEGYLTPKSRLKTCDIYESFISEKVLLMYNFFSKKYDEMVHHGNQVHLLVPLADTLKLFSDCKEKLNDQRSLLKYFFEEFKLDYLKTEVLYQNDFEILKNISLIVDKITSLNFSSQETIFELNQCVSNFKTSIFKRIDAVIFLNSDLKERADQLALLLHEIKNNKATAATYEGLYALLSRYPDRWVFYKEILLCYKIYSSQYLIFRENVLQPSLYRGSLLFIEQYELFIGKLRDFISQAERTTEDEELCYQEIQDKMSGFPDFEKERKQFQNALKLAEAKSAKRKVMSDYINKSSVFCEMAELLEDQMQYSEAIGFYKAAINNDAENKDAIQALARCNNRVQLYSEFQKANRFLAQGQYDKALDLYNQILSKDPDLETVKLIRVKVNKLEGKNA